MLALKGLAGWPIIQGLLFMSLWAGHLPVVAEPQDRRLRLVYSGNLNGELEPCGCTETGDMGGLRRRATVIEELREQNGDLILISSGGLFSSTSTTQRITNAFIQDGLQQIGYDAVGVQWSDLIYGAGFLAGSEIPRVASNWVGPEFLRFASIRRPGGTVRYHQWMPSARSPYRALPLSQQPTHDAVDRFVKLLAEGRQHGALNVVATSLGLGDWREQMPMAGIDVLLIGAVDERFAEPRQVEGVLVLQPGSRGQRLGVLDLRLDHSGRLAGWQHRVIEMPPRIPDSPRLDAWYARYSEALMQDYSQRIAAAEPVESGVAPYRGADACRSCHATEFETWTGSRHARAFATLQRVDKAFDANCIACHSVGFGQPGGFVDLAGTPALSDVQCESCHGPGRQHVEAGGQVPIGVPGAAAGACQQCHNTAHSPLFEYADYWPRITHGKAP